MHRITKEQLAENLNNALHQDVGMEGLQTLLYGWLSYRKYGEKYRAAVNHRPWLYWSEVVDLSDYAGYDLSI